MEYNSTLPYNSLNTYNADYEMWYVGDTPVIGGYLGDTQVYPPKEEEGGKPSDGLYMMEAGWNRGIHLTEIPGLNQVGVTNDDIEAIDTFYFSKTKSSYGAFTEANIRAGEWFLVSNEDGRYYGEFTGETSDDGSVIMAKCNRVETQGNFVYGDEDFVILGYFGQFKEAGDQRFFENIFMGDE